MLRDEHPDIDIVKPIRVGNNVYFGYGCIVLPGVTIGNNVIIGAGSIVTRDVPDNTVSVGIPAHVIKSTDEYAVSALAAGHPTKRFNVVDKRQYYVQTYRPQQRS